jgi:ferredoxin-nitrate reductase
MPICPTRGQDGDHANNPIWQVQGDLAHRSSQSMVCVKGATIAESLYKDRLLHPMLRDSLDQPFQRVSWDQALCLRFTYKFRRDLD